MEGRSILPLQDGRASEWPDDVLIQISESQVGRALRTKRWKFGVTAPGISGVRAAACAAYREEFLYDLETDPYERDNLAGRPDTRAIAEELAQRLAARMAAIGEPQPRIDTNADDGDSATRGGRRGE
jgi:arylsulfatase A-like enzyme